MASLGSAPSSNLRLRWPYLIWSAFSGNFEAGLDSMENLKPGASTTSTWPCVPPTCFRPNLSVERIPSFESNDWSIEWPTAFHPLATVLPSISTSISPKPPSPRETLSTGTPSALSMSWPNHCASSLAGARNASAIAMLEAASFAARLLACAQFTFRSAPSGCRTCCVGRCASSAFFAMDINSASCCCRCLLSLWRCPAAEREAAADTMHATLVSFWQNWLEATSP